MDEEEIKDDPLNEIPPMEATATVQYKMFKGKLIPRASLRIVSKQSNVSVSFNEDETPGFTVADFGLVYKHNSIFTVSGGVNNIFDTAYYEHLNRRIIGGKANLFEPGRIFYVNLIFSI